MNEQFEEIEKRIQKHKVRKKVLADEMARLSRNLQNEDLLKQGRSLEEARKAESQSDGQYLDSVLQTKTQPVGHLTVTIENLKRSIASQDALIREANRELSQLAAATKVDEENKATLELCGLIKTWAASYRETQNLFWQVVEARKLLLVPVGQLDAVVQRVGRNIAYSVILQSALNPANLGDMSLNSFARAVYNVTRAGFGNYGCKELEIPYDGSMDGEHLVTSDFSDRFSGGLAKAMQTNEEALGKALARALTK